MKWLNNLELYIASITISTTTIIVVCNVFFRYVLGIQFVWMEEVALGCFVWSVYLGSVAAYKSGRLIGVDVLVQLLPKRARLILQGITSFFVFGINVLLTVFSITYMLGSRKITASLEVSYMYINFALVLAFFLMSIYTALALYREIRDIIAQFKKPAKV